MTAYMTVLWITMHGGPLDGASYGIPYLTEEACKKAKVPVGNSLDYDYSMECAALPIEQEVKP